MVATDHSLPESIFLNGFCQYCNRTLFPNAFLLGRVILSLRPATRTIQYSYKHRACYTRTCYIKKK